ncbi:hypothetical protein HK101_008819 [Irineochytrium annulatum]|nr:hypothetical protein HK101_008819 [Irineochytrium annulatum]
MSFFKSHTFAVVGASADPTKFGNKVLRWYLERSLDVIPVNPKADAIEGKACIKVIKDLPNPKSTSLSLVTPPAVTISVLREAKALGIPAVWLQPGTESAEVHAFAKQDAGSMEVIFDCVLVRGDEFMRATRL